MSEVLSKPRHAAVVEPIAPTLCQVSALLHTEPCAYCSVKAWALAERAVLLSAIFIRSRRTLPKLGGLSLEMPVSSGVSVVPAGHRSDGVSEEVVLTYQRKSSSESDGERTHESVQSSRVGVVPLVVVSVAFRQSPLYVVVDTPVRFIGLAPEENPELLPASAASGRSAEHTPPEVYMTCIVTLAFAGCVTSHPASPHVVRPGTKLKLIGADVIVPVVG